MRKRGWIYIFFACSSCVSLDNDLSQIEQWNNDSNDIQKVAARNEYGKSKFSRFFLGKNNRKLWTTPITVNVLKLEDHNFKIIKKGGGRQTLNLRVKDENEDQYVLRSIDKNPTDELPDFLKNTFIGSLVRDQASSGHPYGALTIPKLSDAIDIFHTNPKLYIIGKDEELGEYYDDFAGMLVLLEHRPDEDQSAFDHLGNSKNVVGTRNMLNELLTDNDSKVDVDLYLKTRLFDMLIGDWSRHEDNWRWAEYEQDKGKFFKPIPRDRDNMYFYMTGIFPTLVRIFFKPQYATFKHDLSNIKGLNKSARRMDQLLLSSITYESFKEKADSVVLMLTDEIIDAAMKDLPTEIYQISGPQTAEKLKNRRSQLAEKAKDYYLSLSKYPAIYGTDKHEKFIFTTKGKDLKIEIFKTDKEGEVKKLLYHRLFKAEETKKIHVYSLAGNDNFIFTGSGKTTIKLKIYGGAGEDRYIQSGRKNYKKAVVIESKNGGNSFEVEKGIRIKEKQSIQAKDFDANGMLLNFYLWD